MDETNEVKENLSVFDNLFKVNVNEFTEKKDGLTYLSWSYAWAEVKKRFKDASYVIKKFGEKQLPYVFDENTGYMVFTEVTIEGITHEMWLPVMDNRNKAMKNVPYVIKGSKYDTNVAAATMFDINKTIMRCLVKNLAMFGLGLYIYSGEDLPEEEAAEAKAESKAEVKKPVAKEQVICEVCGKPITNVKRKDGTIATAETIIKESVTKYNQKLCCNCFLEKTKTK